jgi:hypothetical protein
MLLVLSSCGQRQGMVARSVVRGIHLCCRHGAPCNVKLKDYTPFDWDKGFYFNDATTEEERSLILGVTDEGYQEIEGQYVFLKNGKLVYQESEPTNFEGTVPDELSIDTLSGKNFASFASDSSFTVSEESGSHGPWFSLQPKK